MRFDSARLLRLTVFLQLDREGRGRKDAASVLVDRAHGLGGGAEDRPINESTSGSNSVPACLKYCLEMPRSNAGKAGDDRRWTPNCTAERNKPRSAGLWYHPQRVSRAVLCVSVSSFFTAHPQHCPKWCCLPACGHRFQRSDPGAIQTPVLIIGGGVGGVAASMTRAMWAAACSNWSKEYLPGQVKGGGSDAEPAHRAKREGRGRQKASQR